MGGNTDKYVQPYDDYNFKAHPPQQVQMMEIRPMNDLHVKRYDSTDNFQSNYQYRRQDISRKNSAL